MAALPAVRTLPHPFVPVATVTGAMVLALVCVGWLIYFINHISRSISVNHIVDRIAREAELVIDEFMPYPRGAFKLPDRSAPSSAERGAPILNRQSGYIRYVDLNRLVALAKAYQICVHLERRVGHFVPSGVPLMRVSKPERVPAERAQHLIAAFDIGPARTMQQDVEFGIIQIVDIALRAMSPAVNDPSTAISCVDQLSRIIILWLSRVPPPTHYYAPPHVLRRAVDELRRPARYGVRADQALCRRRRRGQLAANARLQRHRRHHWACRHSHRASRTCAPRDDRLCRALADRRNSKAAAAIRGA
jgi:uncharacterized membrane protein